MKTIAAWVRHKVFLASLLALLCVMGGSVANVRPAAAYPAVYFGATGSCSLPDGGTGTYWSDGHTCCPTGVTDGTACLYQKYINPIIALISAAVGIAIAIAIIVGGIEYITSAGDPKRTAEGKQRIVNALIGLVAFAALYAFLQFIIPGGVLNG